MEEIRKQFYRLRDRFIKLSNLTYLSSILLIISGLLPFLDVFLVWRFPNLQTARDIRGALLRDDIWLATLYFSPALIIIAAQFKPYVYAYHFPLFAYTYTGIMYFAPYLGFDMEPSWGNRILIFILVIPLTLLIKGLNMLYKYLVAKEEIQLKTIEAIANLNKKS